MRLTFVYNLRLAKQEESIIKDIMWHSSKVYNMLNYEVKTEARRIKRGLFKTNKGKIINADINGSLNILRKYIKEVFSPNLEIVMCIGREQRPLKKRVA